LSKRIQAEPLDETLAARRRPEPTEHARHDRLAYVLGAILIVFGVLTGAAAFTMVRSHTFNPVVGIVNYFVPSPESVFGKERIFVLLMGLDYDYTTTDQPTSRDARTDKIEAYAIDFPAKVIKTIAVPRDMDAIVNGHEDKINDAYHYGGQANSDAVVGGLLGLPKNDRGSYFDRYIALRINASKDVINAIGGLEVPVTETLNYDDSWGHLHIHFKPGLQHMDGDQAVSYARFRHDACSDPCRIKRQQQISKLIIEKLKNDKFNDLTHIASLIDVIRKNVDTNLSADEMKSLGWAFRDLNLADIHQSQVPFTSDKETRCCGDVLIPDTVGMQKIVADFVGPYVAATPPPSAEALAAVKPAELRVSVRNGSGVPGLGARMADTLRRAGYVIESVGNAASFDFDVTQIRAGAQTPLAGERIRSDIRLPQAQVIPVPVPALVSAATTAAAAPIATEPAKVALTAVTVTVGRDYVNVPISSPAPAISTKL
jgi:polyisoprenyl-teichoic acid--peptidoglycan teichoic acid transferase